MSKFIDIDKAGECLRNIVDSNRCGFCDKLSDIFLRCTYGHIACKECSAKEEGCLTCFTTFNSPVLTNTWAVDELQAEKTKNALHLLNTFQDMFKIDVYRRQRLSDQLKAEKELFPDCIQAPVKYCNKRKSINIFSSHNKENSQQSYYPGENTSPFQKPRMEKSRYIRKWLEGAENALPRKPLASMNVNNQSFIGATIKDKKNRTTSRSSIIKSSTHIKSKKPTKKSKSRKNSFSRNQNQSILKNLVTTSYKEPMIIEKQSSIKDIIQHKNPSKTDKQDDSGIVMDGECIVIEDTQIETVDKDELALRAVHEAEKQEYLEYSSLQDEVDTHCNKKEKLKVPYTKKSYLYSSCPNCNKDGPIQPNIQEQKVKNISITIEYGNKGESLNKQSISVQTDISDMNKSDNTVTSSIKKNDTEKHQQLELKNHSFIEKDEIISQDIFMNDTITPSAATLDFSTNMGQMTPNMESHNKKDGLFIEESDTDVSITEAEHMQVAAEVHRASLPRDYDVLTELPIVAMRTRQRAAKRGATPGSTDSSEKENCDPNRVKRPKCIKKGKKKSNKH